MSFAAPHGRGYPYVYAKKRPFPKAGDFTLTVNMRIDDFRSNGTGLVAAETDPRPADGGDIPFGSGEVFRIWVNGVFVLGQKFGDVPAGMHEYRLDYSNGQYTLRLDGAQLGASVASEQRPTALWLGNPVFAWWINDDWTDFSIDSISVQAPANQK